MSSSSGWWWRVVAAMPRAVRDVECQCPEVGEDPEDEDEDEEVEVGVRVRVRVVHDRVSACERIQIGMNILRDEWPGLLTMAGLVVLILHQPTLAARVQDWYNTRRARPAAASALSSA